MKGNGAVFIRRSEKKKETKRGSERPVDVGVREGQIANGKGHSKKGT